MKVDIGKSMDSNRLGEVLITSVVELGFEHEVDIACRFKYDLRSLREQMYLGKRIIIRKRSDNVDSEGFPLQGFELNISINDADSSGRKIEVDGFDFKEAYASREGSEAERSSITDYFRTVRDNLY